MKNQFYSAPLSLLQKKVYDPKSTESITIRDIATLLEHGAINDVMALLESWNSQKGDKTPFLYLQTLCKLQSGHLSEALKSLDSLRTRISKTAEGDELDFHLTLLRGQILCAQGDCDRAQEIYDSLGQIETPISEKQQNCISISSAWLKILSNQPSAARMILQKVERAFDAQTAYLVDLLSGILDLIEGDEASAEETFNQILETKDPNDKGVTTCIARFYLAYIYLMGDTPALAKPFCTSAIDWLSARPIGFIDFVYPPILWKTLELAPSLDIAPADIEKTRRQLIGFSLDDLNRYLSNMEQESNGEPAPRESIRSIYSDISTRAKLPVRLTLDKMQKSGEIRMENLAGLRSYFVTSRTSALLNWTVVGVYLLYLQGRNRAEIAKMLGVTENTVRTYINQIYNNFGLHERDYASQEKRFQDLVDQARDEGIID